VACHVINVGTCCSNSLNQLWVDSSVDKRVLIVAVKVEHSNLRKNKHFLHQIKLNWL
jgi:hypothetical protein